MDRRALLKWAAAGTAGAALPDWILGAFFQDGQAPDPKAEARRLLDDSWAKAREVGKPLLVFVIPGNPNEHWDRGLLLGGVVNRASDVALADLSLAEVVCAPVEAVRSRFADAKFSGEPLAIVLEPSGDGVRATVVDPKLPDPLDRATQGGRWEKKESREERAEERVALATEAIRRSLLPDRAALEGRAKAARAALSAKEVGELEKTSEGSEILPLGWGDRGAAFLRLLAEEHPDRRERIIRALRGAAALRLLVSPPAGAKWAASTGCGVAVEGEGKGLALGCGMGFVPKVSQRLLVFLTEP